ncbi:MAG: SgcJ/EcaC family oxidoreductase [Gemmatimonadota bacterium]|jgi:uncharacterized protein (TIGR02246 family)
MRRFAMGGLVLLALAACQPAEEPLTDSERAEIDTAVRAVFQTMVDGMNEDDAEKILSAYARDILYTGDGRLQEGWEVFSEDVRTTYAEPPPVPWMHRVEEIRVKVLSRDYAILMASGASGPEYQYGYSVTDLFQRTPEGWLVIHEHESDTSPPEDEG